MQLNTTSYINQLSNQLQIPVLSLDIKISIVLFSRSTLRIRPYQRVFIFKQMYNSHFRSDNTTEVCHYQIS